MVVLILSPLFCKVCESIFDPSTYADPRLGVLLKVIWVQSVGCTIVKGNTTILAATFIYSMNLDFVVLCLTLYKLAWTQHISGTSELHSKLLHMVFTNGLVYFILVYVLFLLEF